MPNPNMEGVLGFTWNQNALGPLVVLRDTPKCYTFLETLLIEVNIFSFFLGGGFWFQILFGVENNHILKKTAICFESSKEEFEGKFQITIHSKMINIFVSH